MGADGVELGVGFLNRGSNRRVRQARRGGLVEQISVEKMKPVYLSIVPPYAEDLKHEAQAIHGSTILRTQSGSQGVGGSVGKITKDRLVGWSEKGAMALHTHGPIRTG